MPTRKALKVLWAATFNTVVGPNAVAYGLTTAQMTEFSTVNTNLQAAWQIAMDPSTRTKGAVANFNNALRAMTQLATNLNRIIQGTSTVTDTMRINAGLRVYKTTRTPEGVPTQKPYLTSRGVDGQWVTIELGQDISRRSKPAGVAGATILMATSPTAPASDWQFVTNTTKTKLTVQLPTGAAGGYVYLTAFWTNSKDEAGPKANALPVFVSPGIAAMADEAKFPAMKAA